MGESWIVSHLNAALSTWNDKLAEIWSLLTESPQTFKGGQVWGVMTGIHGALQAIGYGLLVLFFAVGVMKTCGSFVEVKKPEHALKLFIRFALAKGAVTYGLELMLAVFSIVQGMVSTIITQSGSSGMSSVSLPQELIDAINNVGFWDSIPLWAVTLIGGLLITVLSFTMILTVYGRMFSLWMYAAIAPIPLSTFAGEPTSSVGKNFIRSYAGVCLQGVVIALSCIIFSAISSSPPAVDTGASVVTAVWTYRHSRQRRGQLGRQLWLLRQARPRRRPANPLRPLPNHLRHRRPAGAGRAGHWLRRAHRAGHRGSLAF